MQDMSSVVPRQASPGPVHEEVVFDPSLRAPSEPGSNNPCSFGAEETHTILLTLAATNDECARGEVDILNTQVQCFGDAQAAIHQQSNQRFVPPAFKSVRTPFQQIADVAVLWNSRQGFPDSYRETPHRGFLNQARVKAPVEKRLQAPEMLVDAYNFHLIL